jgi:SpoVK/Ycf46/Vps4 family AAA+-type ATPase
LADRQASGHQHSVEEISEFLRRIPEAIKSKVLIIGMTNRLDMIDQAILRRGRFDHIIKVDMASEQEIFDLLKKLVSELPTEDDVDAQPIASSLGGRPLSDVAFVVREGARLAARAGKDKLDQASLLRALETAPTRDEQSSSKRIGFMV